MGGELCIEGVVGLRRLGGSSLVTGGEARIFRRVGRSDTTCEAAHADITATRTTLQEGGEAMRSLFEARQEILKGCLADAHLGNAEVGYSARIEGPGLVLPGVEVEKLAHVDHPFFGTLW